MRDMSGFSSAGRDDRRFSRLLGIAGVLGLAVCGGVPAPSADASKLATAPKTYGQVPLAFEPNRGQSDNQVQFLARGTGYQVFLTSGEAVFAFTPAAGESARRKELPTETKKALAVRNTKSATVRMQIVGANGDLQGVGLEALPGKVNYLRGNDPKKWRTNVPTYGRVRYNGVYPGIDLVYYGNSRQLEYDFINMRGTPQPAGRPCP